jgi:hypothetical protein
MNGFATGVKHLGIALLLSAPGWRRQDAQTQGRGGRQSGGRADAGLEARAFYAGRRRHP